MRKGRRGGLRRARPYLYRDRAPHTARRGGATGARPSDAAVQKALSGIAGHRSDANACHLDCQTDLTDAPSDAVGIDLSRRVMTKGLVRSLMAEVKRPRG